MLVLSGCVGPRYDERAFGGGEGWVGRPLVVQMRCELGSNCFAFKELLEVRDARFEEVPGVGLKNGIQVHVLCDTSHE